MSLFKSFYKFCINWYDSYKFYGKGKLIYAIQYICIWFCSTFRAWIIQINME